MKITPELIEKAKLAKSAEELIALAKENGIELTEESAKACFDRLNNGGELADDELDNVAGGGDGCGFIADITDKNPLRFDNPNPPRVF